MTEKYETGHAAPKFAHRSETPRAPDSSHSYSSQELFRGSQEIAIEHQGASYRLRITRTGGLILNK